MNTRIYPSGDRMYSAEIVHGKSRAMRTGFKTREEACVWLAMMRPKIKSVTEIYDPVSYRYVHTNTVKNRIGRTLLHNILHDDRN